MIATLAVWAVAGATLAQPCEWPSVVTFRVGETKCTGTLVHPDVFVTAAHCVEAGDPGRVRFGEDFSPYALRLDVARCYVHDVYFETRSPGDDYAVCVLAESAVGIPIIPIAMGCDTAALTAGTPAAIVGFGQPEVDGAFGLKRWARTVIADVDRPPGLLAVGDANVNGCLGDSGGPGFVQLPDGTWRAFGVLVAGPACGDGPSTYATLDFRLAWFEAQTGIDLTPCHDADGTWNPGLSCRDFATTPIAPDATWDDACRGSGFAPPQACAAGLTEPEPEPESDAATTSGGQDASTEPTAAASSRCAIGPNRPSAPPWMLLVCVALARRTRRRRRGATQLLECDRGPRVLRTRPRRGAAPSLED